MAAALEFAENGFSVLAAPGLCRSLRVEGLDESNSRELLATSATVRDFAASPQMLDLVEPILGKGAFAVRALFFNKTPDSNWLVPWHQDLTICVRERLAVDGYGPWSRKGGIDHVQPPARVLENMLAVRIHLDRADSLTGGLRVLPGSAWGGFPQFKSSRVDPVACDVDAGGIILHSSSRSRTPGARRVIHIEYANCDLDGGLAWC